MSKLCTKCNTMKSYEEFNNNKNADDGKQSYCRECMNSERRKDAMLGIPIYKYICSTYWYPSADEADNDEITVSADAVYNTLDAAIEYMFENISNLVYHGAVGMPRLREIVTMYWDPVNDQMRVTCRAGSISKYKFLISRVNMIGEK